MLVKYFGPACLAGITLQDWLMLLAENGFRVSPRYWGKIPFLTVSSVCTTLFQPVEQALFGSQIREQQPEPPVFVLGCWRSGTTHLHNLLTLDQRYAFPNMFQTMYPNTFLVSESWLRPMLDAMTPRKRFMDNMDQGLREPHEDEMALAIMSRRSNMLSWAFPHNAQRYDRFLDFANTTDDDRNRWKQALDLFVRKLTLRTGRRLVLKSPNHTARIRLLLEMYPDAKFVHLKRHPYDVFRSMCHMASKVQPVWGLQHMPPEEIPGMVIETYQRLYNAYLEQRALIPAGNLHEISYEDLVAEPTAVLRQTYESLDLGEFDAFHQQLQPYLEKNASYKKNKHAELPADDRDRLHTAWARYFTEFGYTMDADNPAPTSST
ncbi:MAG: sulfotransferase [Planctomycetaceae bacterium]|nr:sulfotransferase [Planctomycetaceae bacterium]